MEKKQRIAVFIRNAAVLIVAGFFIYINHQLAYSEFVYNTGNFQLPIYIYQTIILLGALICALMLQQEKILNSICKKTFKIQWEMIFLGTLGLILSLFRFWITIFSSNQFFGNIKFSNFIGVTGHSIMMNYSWDIICMFASVIFFVKAFTAETVETDSDTHIFKNKQRIMSIVWNGVVFLVIGFLLYLNYILTHFQFLSKMPNAEVMNKDLFYILNIVSTLICAFMLQREEILNIIHNRKTVKIYWEMICLGTVALVLAFLRFWIILLFPDLFVSINPHNIIEVTCHRIMLNYFWDVICAFASVMFFVKSFRVKDVESE